MASVVLKSIVRAATALELQRGTVPSQARFAGFVEEISAEGIRGWAFDLREPATPIIITARLDEHVIAVGATGISRQDVTEALQDQLEGSAPDTPGFLLQPHVPESVLAQAGRRKIALDICIVSGSDCHQLRHDIPPRRAQGWQQLLGEDALVQTSKQILPEYAGHALAVRADLERAVPDALAAEIRDAPMFDADFYALRAEEAQLWLSKGLGAAGPLMCARHFCCIGSRFGIVPAPGVVFDPHYFTGKYAVPEDEAPILTFVRRWHGGVSYFPSAADEELAAEQLQAKAPGITAPPSPQEDPAPASPEDRAVFDILLQELLPIGDAEITGAMKALSRLGGFDASYYLMQNRDVAQAGISPLYHYVSKGEREGRRPNPDFDPFYYMMLHEDVRLHAHSALTHYMEFGRQEGRRSQPPALQRQRHVTGKPILIVGHSAFRAGAERVLLELVKWMALHTARPITVYLLAGGPLVSEFAEYAQVITAPKDPDLHQALRSVLIERDWGFVYLNTVVGGGFLAGLDPRRLAGLPIVGHIHELTAVLEQHETALLPLLEHAKYLISASPASTTHLKEHYGVAADRIETIEAFIAPQHPESADPAEARAEARKLLDLPPDAKVVMGCGTLYWRKGPDIFLETALRLLDAAVTPLFFVWVGSGEDHEALAAQAVAAGYESQIRFIGESNRAAALLAAADLFFLSSREDPFPLVVMEAAQFGAPSVYFEGKTGIDSFTGLDGGYGLEFKAPELLAEEIDRILGDMEDVRYRGAVARERVYRHFTAAAQCLRIYHKTLARAGLDPLVSVIVPNYQHAPYLPERLASIRDQSLKDFELIVLDDGSSDDSLAVIEAELADMPNARLIANAKNTGQVFQQWEKGLRAARAPFVWIAESDDRAAPDFLQLLVPHLSKQGTAIAAGRTIPFTADGPDPTAMDGYLNSQCPGLFDAPFFLDGDRFVRLGMGAACLLVNASGLLFRTEALLSKIHLGQDYSMAGDWAVYLALLERGKIAYEPKAVNEFRRHPSSRVHKVEGTPEYFEERRKIAEQVYDSFAVNQSLHGRIAGTLQHELDRFRRRSPELTLEQVLPDHARPTRKSAPNVALYVHGMLLSRGGIERLAAQLSRTLAARGYQVHIICRVWGTTEPVYPLHDTVRIAAIYDENREAESIAAVHRYLVDNEVDVFIPMLSEWLFAPLIEAGRRAGVRIIASEHNDPWKIEELWWSREDRQKAFAQVDRIHLLSKAFLSSLPEGLREKAVVIPNGVDLDQFRPSGKEPAKAIVAVGRLSPQKRFDLLIDGFAQSGLAEAGWVLKIYGEGHDRIPLNAQIKDLGLSQSAFLMGTAEGLNTIYASAAFTVMSSDFEGFGLVVVESLAAGTPVLAFADCNGPNEILRSGKEGLLVEPGEDRAKSLAEGMAELASDPCLRAKLGEAGVARARKYSLSKFEENWETLLEAMRD